uniref:Short-chain collagen C4 n=1 Tax=Magallana gigas TaxID=29159 RepID=K1PYU7_MAGGI
MEIPWILTVFEHHELMTKLTLQEGVDLFSFLIEYDLGQILIGRSAKITSCQNFCHKNTLYTGVFKVAVNVNYFSDDIVRAGGSGDIVPSNMKKQAIRLVYKKKLALVILQLVHLQRMTQLQKVIRCVLVDDQHREEKPWLDKQYREILPTDQSRQQTARRSCYKGWKLEYHGYLMAGYYNHDAGTTYTCVDSYPDALHGGATNKDGKLFYMVEAACGSLKCPPYVAGRELVCAVCSKQ